MRAELMVRVVGTLAVSLRAVLGRCAIAGYRLGAHVRVDLFEAADLVQEAELRLAGRRTRRSRPPGRRCASSARAAC